MTVQVSYPGVYIDEFAPGAPIQGVGTSTAAFIGVAMRGELNDPTKLTSWDQFRAQYGETPVPGFFLWFAVRGFFENGGQVCYIVRASNGAYASLDLPNANGDAIARLRARQPGNPGTPIQAAVALTHLLTAANTSLYQPTGNYTAIAGRDVTMTNAAEAARFRPGDVILIAGQTVQVIRVGGAVLRIANQLSAPPATGAVRLADLPAGTTTLRVQSTVPLPPGGLARGTMLTITQGGNAQTVIVESMQSEPINPTLTTYRVGLRSGTTATISQASAATVQSEDFNLTISQGAGSVTYNNLSVDSAHPRYFVDVVNSTDRLVRVVAVEPPPVALPPDNLPDALAATALAGGANEDLTTIADNHFINALRALEAVDDVNLVAVPDSQALAVQQAVIAHCELMADRFGVLDSTAGIPLFGANGVESQRQGVDSTRGYAGLYYPWLRVLPQGAGAPVLVPPSGHVCGIMARSDSKNGVHKAPANEYVNGALGVERPMSDIDQGQLNLIGINVIRVFGGGRPILWGARTTATDRNWQYVNVRRLFLYVEESVQEGIRWAVFQPNNLQLWQKLRRTINEFLNRVWRDGGLFGEKSTDAYYVRIDEDLNPFADRALGRLTIEIGMQPTYPAEFIVLRIGIWQGGSEVTEG